MKRTNVTTALITALKLCGFGLLLGALGGFVGALFSHLLAFVTHTRETFPWLLLLLPVGSIVTVGLYRVCGLGDHGGTNEIIRCLKDGHPIRALAAPLIFVCTVITHLLGGSTGREGAAIQLGGTGASAVSKLFRLQDHEHAVSILCGMSAVFAGVFGTPLTAAVFMLEFRSDKKVFSFAVLPCLLSAVTASTVSKWMGVTAESALIPTTAFSFLTVGKIMVLAIGCILLGAAMCAIFRVTSHAAKTWLSNPFVRGIVGAVLVIVLTALVGDMRYNGSGMELVMRAIEGDADWYDFALKLVFTAVTLAAGFKGGEIVPTFCIGATFGCVLGGLLGLNAGFAAALGLVGLFCCVTNSPLAAILLGFELFGPSALPYFLLLCVIVWPLSTPKGLFANRFFLLKSTKA